MLLNVALLKELLKIQINLFLECVFNNFSFILPEFLIKNFD